MTPTYLNSPSPFSYQVEQYNDDLHHDHPIIISQNKIHHDGHGASSASCDLSSPTLSNSSSLITQNYRSVFHHKVLQQAPVQQDQADDYDFQGGLYGVESYSSSNDRELKLSIFEKENKFEHHHPWYHESTRTCSKLKWMSPNMRLPQKIKKNNIDPTAVNPTPSATTLIKPEDHKKDQAPLSPMDTDISSNTASSTSSTNLIRVCSDCSTTKTPLWRSGPQGPKSLCNACGIRQRKARRAMAEANETSGMTMTRLLGVKITKTKKQQREKGSSTSIGHNVVTKFKKRRSKITSDSRPTSSSRFEDLPLKLTNDLAHFDNHVFPQDEKEAAILLMALSCDRFLPSP